MNLIPEQIPWNCNYLCTWYTQTMVALETVGADEESNNIRNLLNEHMLFEEDTFHIAPKKHMSGLILLLDDGWDVPYSPDMKTRNQFGSCIPDKERFASFGETGEEILCNLSKKVKEMGYSGLGLWISPQEVGKPAEMDLEKARKYWSERAKMCAKADIKYWKVDWGFRNEYAEYREMMTQCVKEHAPGLIIEHAVNEWAFKHINSPKHALAPKAEEFLRFSDAFRTYDIEAPFEDSLTLCRIYSLLYKWNNNNFKYQTKGYIVAEGQAMVAAGLGFNVGIMKYDNDVEALLNWQRISPPFAVAESDFKYSKNMLKESHYFSHMLTPWQTTIDELYEFEVPEVMVRGTKLPNVSCEGLKPFVIASVNPHTKAYAVSTIKRAVEPNYNMVGLADITIYPESYENMVGIFGYYNSLCIEFGNEIPKGAKVFVQCLLADEAVDVTDEVKICGNKITLDGIKLRKYASLSNEKNEDTPALVLAIK